jgi:hypothetical protein
VTDIRWPVQLVSLQTGNPVVAHNRAELNTLVASGQYRLRRAVPGLNLAVAQPSRAEQPREVTSWRGQDTEPQPAAEPAPDPTAEPEPERPARPTRSRSKTRK